MSYTRNDVIVLRDCPAVAVPYGSPVTIEKGCEATITQQLGGSYTVMVEGNLYRIEGADGDALGFEVDEATLHMHDGPVTAQAVEDAAWSLLATCFDPEIPVDIVNLGLVYSCKVSPAAEGQFRIEVQMTLTAPGCGMGTMIADEARNKLLSIHGVDEVTVDLVWDPPWSREMISEPARLQMGLL
ncbi:putative Fe-S cluster assembly protein SufT [Pollutimonas thiosulfatoxidans]|uniref:Putative Fe-S cluster assembly protein SufT n=1 Tax=Pollutimonas thiosulfatoxidans TaxID=2028345 RepID=A0A410GAK3_9BURK|nr:putative Fe-S cluster assembly protein SufT [Pollutimonas thiosulfatoxidans]MBF6615871.1 putative Fe-S cluster assembly protein SufT [Candidimonas sp.]NYT44820.1 putative Fe-S cluster assembly protein SufT [Alcaligenaceae bacterium]QAA93311.1 putative Fe-S cluster assembly protein SufT [Pollutimonas thiosulfatoxidans]